MSSQTVSPHGSSRLVNQMASSERAEELRMDALNWPSWTLNDRQICDLELLLNGGFTPLAGFMTQRDYHGVCDDMRLSDGTLWPMPIALDVTDAVAKQLSPGAGLALRDTEGILLAVLHVQDIWQPDRRAEAKAVFGTVNPEHPGVDYLLNRTHRWYAGGVLEGLELPRHYDFKDIRLTPVQLRQHIRDRGWQRVIAFQTRNPMHRAHYELTLQAVRNLNANLLINPVVGAARPGDVDYYTRVRCYQALLEKYPHDAVMLSLLPLAMRMGGPREALWHAIIRRNYGCTHLIVGRDHAGPGSASDGTPFYDPYAAQKLLMEYGEEIGMSIVPFQMMVYCPDRDEYLPADEVTEETETCNLSGTELRRRLRQGLPIPEWFSFPEVVKELRRTYPSSSQRGFTVFFTGLPGSGKSRIAKVLLVKLLERGGRPVTFLDGDIVRAELSHELGFSREHRDMNIRRIGFVAAEVTRNGGIAICSPIAPYDQVRKEVRNLIEIGGGFVLVHVDTSLEVCEARDPKGLYAKARTGIVQGFTGISDPYEPPGDAQVTVETAHIEPEVCADEILSFLKKQGWL